MAIVVLGLSVDLVKGQKIGDAPTTTKYSTFTGGFGLAVAVLGLVSVFIDTIPTLVVMAADTLSGVLLLGGGIVSLSMIVPRTCYSQDGRLSQLGYAVLRVTKITGKPLGTTISSTVENSSKMESGTSHLA